MRVSLFSLNCHAFDEMLQTLSLDTSIELHIFVTSVSDHEHYRSLFNPRHAWKETLQIITRELRLFELLGSQKVTLVTTSVSTRRDANWSSHIETCLDKNRKDGVTSESSAKNLECFGEAFRIKVPCASGW